MRIILDYGGTVVDTVDEYEYSSGIDDGGVIENPSYVAYKSFSLGILSTEDEYLSALSTLSNSSLEECRAYLEERKRATTLPEDRERLLRELADEHSLALFTDQVRPWIDEELERLGVADIFDEVVVSSDLGYEKPHPEGYATLSEGHDDAVMVSDEANDDLLMADYFGMETVWIENDYETVYFEPDHRIDDLSEVGEVL